MTASLDEMMPELPPEQRRRTEERAAELIAEEMTLRERRKARELTQAKAARELSISQDAISRLEQRGDLLLSTRNRSGSGGYARCQAGLNGRKVAASLGTASFR